MDIPSAFVPPPSYESLSMPEAMESHEIPCSVPTDSNGSLIQVCSIALSKTDRIILVGCTTDTIREIRSIIRICWGNIQKDKTSNLGSHEFKLRGTPFLGCCNLKDKDAVDSRYLLIGILSCMASTGWNLLQSVDINRIGYDIDTMFFEKGQMDPEPMLFAVYLTTDGKIRLIDAPNGIFLSLKDAIGAMWGSGIKSITNGHRSVDIQLAGSPWSGISGPKFVVCRLLLCQIIANFRSLKYKLYGTIDTNGSDPDEDNDRRDLETWIFRKITPQWK